MALQTSGAISFADLQTEFGGSNPVSLSEYVRNIGDTSLTGGGNEIRYTSIVDGSTFKLGADTAPANLIFQKHQKNFRHSLKIIFYQEFLFHRIFCC